jgi:hypothetical protein
MSADGGSSARAGLGIVIDKATVAKAAADFALVNAMSTPHFFPAGPLDTWWRETPAWSAGGRLVRLAADD